MNDTTEFPNPAETADGTAIFADTEVLDDSAITPDTTSTEPDAARPRVRIGAVVWGLFVTIVAVDQFSAWLRRRLIGQQSFEFGRGAA